MRTTITFHYGDVRDVMATMTDASVDLVVTSPPFLALRSYLPADHPDKHREIGSEPTPADFLDTLLGLSGEWRRLITPTGSIAVEIGDTYSGSGGAGGDYNADGLREGQQRFDGAASRARRLHPDKDGRHRDSHGRVEERYNRCENGGSGWPLAKSLCGIPTLYTWSLAYGRNLLTGQPSPAGQWRIRNLLTWTRPNPPVGALGDKFRPATSFVTVACVSDKRWFDLDAVRTDSAYIDDPRHLRPDHKMNGRDVGLRNSGPNPAGAPPLDWWEHDWQPLHRMPTAPYRGAHYATYPVALPERLILAMCPLEVCRECVEPRRRIVGRTPDYAAARDAIGDFNQRGRDGHGVSGSRSILSKAAGRDITCAENITLGWSDCGHNNYRRGIVLDPFGGSGTTAVAAAQAGRDAVLIDLDARNIDLTQQRLAENFHIVNEHHNGDTTTWTVEARLPDQREQADGQTTIFDLAGATA